MNADAWDRGLVVRAQSGDRSAFDVLVRKYWHRVMKLAMRYTPHRADAGDVVQEAFMKAYGPCLVLEANLHSIHGCIGSRSTRQ